MTQRGRKRKAGDRHPGGQLVQKIEPNPVVIAQRLAVLGGHSTHHHAESPMSVALARAYITEDQHKAGETIARLYRATHPQRRMIIALHDYDPADRDPTPIANMPHADIATAFEAILAKTQAPGSDEDRQIKARKRYNDLCLTLRPISQIEIFNAFCMNICPLWLSWRIAGRIQSRHLLHFI